MPKWAESSELRQTEAQTQLLAMTPHNNAGVKSRGGQLPGGLSNPHPHQMQIQARNIRTLHPEIAGIRMYDKGGQSWPWVQEIKI